MRGENNEAIAHLLDTVEMHPNYGLAHWLLGRTYVEAALYQEAAASLERAFRLLAGSPGPESDLARVHALKGNLSASERIRDRMARKYGNTTELFLARVCAALGERDGALRALDRAVRESAFDSQFLLIEPAFDRLRRNGRYRELLDAANLAP